MRTSKLVTDSLWQCLCPSFTRHSLRQSIAVLGARRSVSQCLGSPSTNRKPFSSQARLNNEGAPSSQLKTEAEDEAQNRPPLFGSLTDLDNPRRTRPKFEASTGIRQSGSKRQINFDDETTPILYEMARMSASHGYTNDVRNIVNYLVTRRREQPNLRLYGALILSNVNPTEGAAWRVATLLEEMAEEGLSMDVGICHDVLKASGINFCVHIFLLIKGNGHLCFAVPSLAFCLSPVHI